MAAAVPYIAAGVSVVGSVMEYQAGQEASRAASRAAFAQAMSAQAAANISEKNAQIMEADALARNQKASEDASNKRKEVQRLVAAARAQEGASGFSFSGTPEWLEYYSLAEGEKDAMAILNEGFTESSRMLSTADIYRMEKESFLRESDSYTGQGRSIKKQGQIAGYGTLLKGLGSAGSAYTKAGGTYPSFSKSTYVYKPPGGLGSKE